MPQERIIDRWSELREMALAQWDRLTDRDLDQVEGRRERLVGLLQRRYGWAREQTTYMIDEFEQGVRYDAEEMPFTD